MSHIYKERKTVKGQKFKPIQIHYEHPTLQKETTEVKKEMKTRRNTKTKTKSGLGLSSIFLYFLNFKSYITLFKS